MIFISTIKSEVLYKALSVFVPVNLNVYVPPYVFKFAATVTFKVAVLKVMNEGRLEPLDSANE